MAIPNNYGRLWGQIPNTAGQVFWVAPSAAYTVNGQSHRASDDLDGLDPQRALLTIDRAWNLVGANQGDVIVLLPGTHSPAASIVADVAGVTMMGLPAGAGHPYQQRVKIGAVTGDQNVNVTAAGIEIAYINFIPVTADSAIDLTGDADQLLIHHCSFDLNTPAASTGTIGIDSIGTATHVVIENCFFESDGAQGPGIVASGLLRGRIKGCTFQTFGGTWAVALLCGAGTGGLLIDACSFIDFAGTITAGVSGTGATIANGVSVQNCRFGVGVTVPVDNFDAAECTLSENFDHGVGACDGGALIVAIT